MQEKFLALKQKITPKNKLTAGKDKFDVADNFLVPEEDSKNFTPVLRKTFSIPKDEVTSFRKIKNRALDYRVVLSDSEIVRLGLSLVIQLAEKDFQEAILNIEKIVCGRPKNLS